MSFKRERLCGSCHQSLFIKPKSELFICSCQLYSYWNYYSLMQDCETEESESVIVNIYDYKKPCLHYFHLRCLTAHKTHCRQTLGISPEEKIPCPVPTCEAKFRDYTTLTFIPIKQYQAQFEEQNPGWCILNEYQFDFTTWLPN